MKIDLLPKKQAFRANLHTHSNLSDGKLTPEELVRLYREHGYQILAITDHEFCVDHSDLNSEGFLTLTGYELQIADENIHPRQMNQRCCHLCMISRDPHSFRHVYFNPESYDLLRLCKKHELIPSLKSVGRRPAFKEYSKDVIEEVVKTATGNGLLVAFNHPSWSLENDYQSYSHLKGVYAMEIYNNDCNTLGIEEYNPAVYDRMLREGIRTGCIATDDAHYGHPLGDPKCDLFGGWTMIMADDLSYDKVIAALEKGDFYATTGPEIREISVEDGKVHVVTSPAKQIALTTGGRRAELLRAEEGQTVTEAYFSVRPGDIYIRITVRDEAWKSANSRGYFLDEFMK